MACNQSVPSTPLCIWAYLAPRKDDNNGHQARHEHDGQGCEARTPPPGLAVSRPARVCYRHARWSRRAVKLYFAVCRVCVGMCRECGRNEFDLRAWCGVAGREVRWGEDRDGKGASL
jgi:hypothetical protein